MPGEFAHRGLLTHSPLDVVGLEIGGQHLHRQHAIELGLAAVIPDAEPAWASIAVIAPRADNARYLFRGRGRETGMVDRFLVWMGAGMVTAGVAAAMVAGAGVAMADSPPGSDAKGTTSSESAKPADTKADSGIDGAAAPKPKPVGKKPKKTGPTSMAPIGPMRPSRATTPRPRTNGRPNSRPPRRSRTR